MRCKDFRHRILGDDPGPDTPPDLFREMDGHAAQCPACGHFRDHMEAVRAELRDLPEPALSGLVENRVRTFLRNAGAAHRAPAEPLPPRWGSFTIPRLIWGAIPVLIVLTTVVMAAGLQDILTQTSSWRASAFVFLLLQNAAMLVFAPILIRALRRKASPDVWQHGDAHVS